MNLHKKIIKKYKRESDKMKEPYSNKIWLNPEWQMVKLHREMEIYLHSKHLLIWIELLMVTHKSVKTDEMIVKYF
jgi:hypothetical protein